MARRCQPLTVGVLPGAQRVGNAVRPPWDAEVARTGPSGAKANRPTALPPITSCHAGCTPAEVHAQSPWSTSRTFSAPEAVLLRRDVRPAPQMGREMGPSPVGNWCRSTMIRSSGGAAAIPALRPTSPGVRRRPDRGVSPGAPWKSGVFHTARLNLRRRPGWWITPAGPRGERPWSRRGRPARVNPDPGCWDRHNPFNRQMTTWPKK